MPYNGYGVRERHKAVPLLSAEHVWRMFKPPIRATRELQSFRRTFGSDSFHIIYDLLRLDLGIEQIMNHQN